MKYSVASAALIGHALALAAPAGNTPVDTTLIPATTVAEQTLVPPTTIPTGQTLIPPTTVPSGQTTLPPSTVGTPLHTTGPLPNDCQSQLNLCISKAGSDEASCHSAYQSCLSSSASPTPSPSITPGSMPLAAAASQVCNHNMIGCAAIGKPQAECQASASSCYAAITGGTTLPTPITTPLPGNGTAGAPQISTITYYDTQCGCTKTSTTHPQPTAGAPYLPSTTTVINGVPCTIGAAPSGNGVVFNGQTITPGAAPTQIGGQQVSFVPGNGGAPSVQIGTQTIAAPTAGAVSGSGSYGGNGTTGGSGSGSSAGSQYTGGASANGVAVGGFVGALAAFFAIAL